ncbi:phosphate ABC transporter permease PstA [uncultured Dialister sp.]|uniref:phosphate ABC transporter permease PstA n=1 Tax=uncultured Dialister sp. TaxID=278064 RepID=UPI0025980762|nr:phosphate ABC transporter permease PstA [uncultured Dialister sp.]
MSTQPAEPMNGKMSDLRFIDGGLKRARFADKTATFFFYFISAAFVFLLVAFTLYVVWGGIKAFKPEVFSFGPQGIGSQFFNTVYLVVLSLLISVPIGVMAGVYMAEYATPGKVTNTLRIAIETLSSLPSIVVGLFGYLVFIIMVHSQWNLFSGALAVSVLSLPLITSTTYDAFKALPEGYKEGSLALGATHFETIWHVMLPATVGPIVTGVILAAGRGFGEAAALLYTAGMSTDINWNVWDVTSPTCPLNPFRPGETLSLQVWAARTEGLGSGAMDTAAAASAVLMIMVLAFSIGARMVSRYISRKTEGENS